MTTAPRPRSALRKFLQSEASSGILLIGAAVIAMMIANSPLSEIYLAGLHKLIGPLTFQSWVNEALMAVFFLLIGLEIKRELYNGQLSSWPRRILPGLAALGGMIVPALIYLGVNLIQPGALKGWAIPAATDIAFALGVLSLLGSRVPVSLKIFLTALAILDDLGAILIIAIFYNAGLDWMARAGAGLVLFMMLVLNRLHVVRLWPYMILAAVLWWFVYKSGIHATIAGVAAAMLIPVKRTPAQPAAERSPLHRLENALEPWVGFLVLPLFAFVNAGVQLGSITPGDVVAPAPLGVALGLFVGKQIGVFAACYAAVRFGLAERPAGASWLQVHGVALLCGVGFTMSLFISLLAFPNDPERIGAVKLGILAGSILSAAVGAGVLYIAGRRGPAVAA